MSNGNNGKVLTVICKLARILTVSRKSHYPIETLLLVFRKIYSCLFIPNCTRNHLITYSYRLWILEDLVTVMQTLDCVFSL